MCLMQDALKFMVVGSPVELLFTRLGKKHYLEQCFLTKVQRRWRKNKQETCYFELCLMVSCYPNAAFGDVRVEHTNQTQH